MLKQARAVNTQVATHAIGDRGNRLVLDAYASLSATNAESLQRARWRIEHAQIIDLADIPRFGKMGVIASMQPSHAIGDLYFAPARLGPDRLIGAYAWRRLLDTGATIAAGSDAPVEKGDPLIEFYAATFRHDLQGRAGARLASIETGGVAVGSPAHARFSRLPTRSFANVSSGHWRRGNSRSPRFTLPTSSTAEPAQILKIRPMLTIVGGIVFNFRWVNEPAAKPAG